MTAEANPSDSSHTPVLSHVRGPEPFRMPLRLKILVVDDHEDSADITAHLLQVCGAEAVACYGSAEALTALDSFRPSVCILDISMPEMNGRELAAAIRAARGPDAPLLVALTGEDDDTVVDGYLFDLWFAKPADPAKLLHALGEYMHARQPAAEGGESKS